MGYMVKMSTLKGRNFGRGNILRFGCAFEIRRGDLVSNCL